MTKLEIFNKLIEKAKSNGYKGPDYSNQIGHIIDGTNIYALIFREDFMRAVCGENNFVRINERDEPIIKWIYVLRGLALARNKWEYLEENVI